MLVDLECHHSYQIPQNVTMVSEVYVFEFLSKKQSDIYTTKRFQFPIFWFPLEAGSEIASPPVPIPPGFLIVCPMIPYQIGQQGSGGSNTTRPWPQREC